MTEQGKQAAARKTQGTGIEPPGGGHVLPTPKKYKEGLHDPEFEKDLIAQIAALG